MKTILISFFIIIFGAHEFCNSQNSVTIGSQEWSMNLNIKQFRNGDPIPRAKTAAEWKKAAENKEPAWCYYNNDPSTSDKHGLLYNWFAVNDDRGLAPEGWKVASKQDWETLLGNYPKHNHAYPLKTKEGWKGGFYGSNSSNFSAYPVGIRGVPNFFHQGKMVIYWTSTELTDEDAFGVTFDASQKNTTRSPQYKTMGLSVRCVKN
ncbi:fibrobacter succinogenes major paralogous domain-containing protein [Mesohalobacter halotolerans]|uniref:Fibrobacter succinogenes major paralogous domain-containing protein n=1 Tax=Mesohalobacter halotolerans TaxID=1883405 RepID=A0A4U5TW21_9FLAO|nr:fibrobacter succinogenes major paralogous domain-containing protein [Mesohalobacter halotolerans]MBS3738254.1 fibrobacter succinogenes major paralogous domain-containing protein [Psychroflexus sp.]TKS57428.1 hypothetical protein FCN74_03135 [Mesohalobacter halotolerans]